MQWLDSMNSAIAYLEDNMAGSVDMDEAARVGLSSRYHFQRLFLALCGLPVGEYVRSRRLTLAAQELSQGGVRGWPETTSPARPCVRVLDVALKYGYETPEAFAKAFSRFHGVPPSAAREPGVRLRSVSRLSFVLTVKGVTPMEYQLVNKEAFRVVGKALRVPMQDAGHSVSIPQFWDEVMNDGTFNTLMAIADTTDSLGLCANFAPDMSSFDYIIGVFSKDGAIPAGCVELHVKPYKWAVFEARGTMPKAIQDLNARVFSEWFPSSGYQHDDGPDIELYPAGEVNDDYMTQVWVPIK